MGTRGSKQSAQVAATAERLTDVLQPLGNIGSRSMFGGYGIFADDLMFALVDPSGQGFLRVDDATRPRFEAADAQGHGRMPYWSIPSDVDADDETLLAWARDALEVARAARR